MKSCPVPHQLALSHWEVWSWQHLANHRDTRRVYCLTCNTFPIKTEVHKCEGPGHETASNPSESPDRRAVTVVPLASESVEELARKEETGFLNPSELNLQRNLLSIILWISTLL